ncbi:hypothetical protein ACXGQW_01320 [Wenyingzhuangia sp. IMCC45533]
MSNVFHQGELKVQDNMGVKHLAAKVGHSINDKIIPGAIPFTENQSTLIISSNDSKGKNWISLLVGPSGFIEVPDANTFDIYIDQLQSDTNDIFFENIKNQKNIGAMFIEFASTRRYRTNGIVYKITENKISIKIIEAYPNCPKYIQKRTLVKNSSIQRQTTTKKGTQLTDEFMDLIKKSDTFFIGSGAANKMDASHRGGKPGFVDIVDSNLLKIPEYIGNNLYNTLGNLESNPNAGLLFIDFKTNSVLQLNGTVSISYNQKTEEDLVHTDTGLFWTFAVDHCIYTINHHAIDWNFEAFSKYNY